MPTLVSDTVPDAAEIVIVGAGLAGCELAVELERRGVRGVALLEAGPADELVHTNLVHDPEEALRRWLEPQSDRYFRQPWTSRFPPHYTGSSGIRQRLGGRSLYWYGVALPIERWALREPWWPEPVVAELTRAWRGGPSLYERVAAKLTAWASPAKGIVDAPTDVEIAGHRLRVAPRAIRPVAESSERWYAYSPLDHWRDPKSGRTLRAPEGVSIHAGLEVVALRVDGGRVRGVAARPAGTTDTTTIDADRVVLAGGTLSSTRLAIQALCDAKAVPEPKLSGLCDHMVQGVFLRLAEPAASRLLARVAPGTYYAPCPDVRRSNLFLDVQPLRGGAVLVDLQLTGEQLPSPESWVECDARAPRPWPMTVHSRPLESDREVLRMQREILPAALAELLAMADHPCPRLEFDSFDDPRHTNGIVLTERVGTMTGAAVTWSGFLGTEDHEGGTLPLGGVLDLDQQFRAVSGLYATGPPTFPRFGAANVGLTGLALSHRLAATLGADGAVAREPEIEDAWASR